MSLWWRTSLHPDRTHHILSKLECIVVLLVVYQAGNQHEHVENLMASSTHVEGMSFLAAFGDSDNIDYGTNHVDKASTSVSTDI